MKNWPDSLGCFSIYRMIPTFKVWSIFMPFCILLVQELAHSPGFLFISHSKCFKILDIYRTQNIPGQANLPVYHEFFVKVLVKSNDLKFDSLWVDQRKIAVHVTRTKGGISSQPVKFSKGDTLLLKASYSLDNSKVSNIPLPFKTNAEAVMSFYQKDKKKYQSIKSIPSRKN